MFDVGSTELLLIIIVAVVVIGPKDLPRARHFRSGIDAMIREAEMEDLQKKWASENRRIMEQYPATDVVEEPVALVAPAEASQNTGAAPHNPESSPAPEKPA